MSASTESKCGADLRAVARALGGGGTADPDRPWRILEMFARNGDLTQILAEVMALFHENCPGSGGAVMVLREGRLCCAASTGIPPDLLAAMDGLPIEIPGEERESPAPFWNSCAGWDDLRTSPRWADWLGLVEAGGFRGCWTEPILSAAGEVLGVLCAFTVSPHQPENAHAEAVRLVARVAGIAIEQKNMVADLFFQAHHDPTTLLPNRFLLENRMHQALAVADRMGISVALLHINLDRFQTVNDLLGYGTGDILLEQVARRIETCLRGADTLARAAGDEFVALLTRLGSIHDARKVAERIRARIAEPFAVAGHEITITASIGVAAYPVHAGEQLALERCANTAMYRAKQEGRNCVREFLAEEARSMQRRARLENALGRALARGELRLVYQPQVDLKTLALVGAEALLRWQHPDIGLVAPGTFIPIAEQSGLIVPIGRWVMEEACRQAMNWHGRVGAPQRVAVNVSAVQFQRPDFVAQVEDVLAASQVPPERVEIELTESALAGDLRQVVRKMMDLKSLGVGLSIDDFGTGYSSLAYVQELPVDTLKIDLSFVRQIAAAGDRSPVIESVVAMARALGKKLIAEGVETLVQQTYLAGLGCDGAQGFLYGRPMETAAFEATWML